MLSQVPPGLVGHRRYDRPGLESPPRWRGARRPAGRRKRASRITPALAGSTRPWRSSPRGRPDHPRAGGEHAGRNALTCAPIGSPPRWRGAHQRHQGLGGGRRITPALAGSTSSSASTPGEPSDHPRAGGEHMADPITKMVGSGSPPRWRGAPRLLRSRSPPRRITPALAGSTTSTAPRTRERSDHPRAGGEHTVASGWTRVTGGSPPRWRGAHFATSDLRMALRFLDCLWFALADHGCSVTRGSVGAGALGRGLVCGRIGRIRKSGCGGGAGSCGR